MTAIMTAIGIGWGITWFPYAADYSRFVSRKVPRRKLYAASTWASSSPWSGSASSVRPWPRRTGRSTPAG